MLKTITDTGTWTTLVTALGGTGGGAGTDIPDGGDGGNGRVHVDYADSSAPSTNPTADTAQVPYVGSFGSEETEADTIIEAVHWKFDEGVGTTTSESIENNNTGTLAGTTIPTWQVESQCISGKCLYFDGTSSKVTLAGSMGFKSVSLWVRPVLTASIAIADFGSSATITTNGSSVIAAGAGFTSPTIYLNGNACSTCTLVANQWQHIAVLTSTTVSGSSMVFGNSSSTYLKGFMDEVRMYGNARTALQVKTDYVARGSNLGVAAQFGNPDIGKMLSNGLVGHWKLDETATPSTDSSGNGNSGTWVNNTTSVSGKFANSASFDGTDDSISIADNDLYSLSTTNQLTVAAWTKFNLLGVRQMIVAKGSGSQYEYDIRLESDNTISAYIFTSDGSVFMGGATTATVTTGTWYHVAMTANITNPTNPTATFFLNGQPIKTFSSSSGSYTNGTAALRFGERADNVEDFKGLLDEARIYNRALEPREIDTLYNWAPGPIGHWKLDENTGTTGYDLSGNSNNLAGASVALTTPTLLTSGSNGQTGSATQTTGSFSPTASKKLLIYVFGACENHTSGFNWSISASAGDTPTLAETSSVYAMGSQTAFNTQSALFELVVAAGGARTFTFDANSGSASVYNYSYAIVEVDNASYAQATVANGANINPESSTATGDLVLGSNPVSGNQVIAFAGKYNLTTGALSNPTSYTSLVNQTQTYTGVGSFYRSDTTSPTVSFTDLGQTVGAWSGFVLELEEVPGSVNWTPGKFGSGLSFNGSTDYVTAGDNNVLDLTDNMTFSTWVYPTAVDNQRVILGKGTNYILQISSGKLRLYNGTSHNDTGASLVANQWLHVAATVDASNITFYQNGIVSSVITRAGTFTANASSFRLGFYEGGSATHYWSGIIDDARIYDYARTPGQIIEDMNGGHPVGGSPIGSQAGWWKFDDGNGTTAQDSGPNNNDMTLSTATSAWTNSGKFNKAWDGNASRYVSRADDPDFDFAASEDFTLSTWIKTDGTSAGASEYILNKSSSTASGYGIYGSSGGKVVFAIDDDATWTPDDQAQSTTNIYDQAWHYIAARKTGTTKIDLFVDGKLEASDATLGATGSMTNAIALYIGDRDGTDNGDEFNGDIDEVKVYRAALSNDQILIDYNRGKSAVMGSTSTASDGVTADNSSAREYCIPGDTTSCSAPVAEWKFDENTGTAANDTSGSGNNGTLNTFPTNPWRTGIQGSALEFDGADDDITAGTSLDLSTSATFTAWIKPDDAGEAGFGTIIAKGPGGGLGYQFYIDDNTDAIALYDGISTTTSASVTYGVWQHVALTINSGAATFYVNGVILDTDTVSLDATGADTVYLGSIDGGTESFDGLIDNIRIYNYARTPAQIAWEYNRGAPVAWYKLDECTGSTAYNSAKNANGAAAGNNGTITIGATGPNTSTGTCSSGTATEAWNNGTTGKVNYSLDFDGSNDYVSTAADTSTLDINQFTLAAWVKYDAVPTGANSWYIMERGQSATNHANFYFWIDADGSVNSTGVSQLVTGFENSVPDAFRDFTTPFSPSASTWYHVATTYDGASSKTYINGELMSTTALADTPYTAGTQLLYIGTNRQQDTQAFMNGKIDDVRIYSYPMTQIQIRDIYNNGAVGFK